MNTLSADDFTGAIFDMDGTLLDSMKVWDDVCNDYLIKRSITPEPGLAKVFQAMTLPQAAVYYRENYGITDSIGKICNEIKEMIAYSYAHTIMPKDGAPEYLCRLKRRKASVYVATVTDRDIAVSAFENTGLMQYIDGILTTDMVGAPKTSPKIFEECLKLMNIKKKDSMVFEDSIHAMRTAADAGFPVTAVFDPTSAREWDEIQKTADYTVMSFRELLV